MMLSGEILHKIFEIVLSSNKKTSNDKILAKINIEIENLFSDFHKKYDNHEIKDTSLIIDGVRSLMTDDVLMQYFDYAKTARKTIEDDIISKHPGASIEFLTEKKIICDFYKSIDGKNKVMGKVDLIVLVDGSPQIVDLKVSAKGISEWAKEKKTKTLYQLATYEKMLSHIGVRSVAPVMKVYNIVVDKDSLTPQKSELRSFSDEIVNDTNIGRNLNSIFENIQKSNISNSQSETEINNIIESLFGNASKKDRRKLNREYLKSQIKTIKRDSG